MTLLFYVALGALMAWPCWLLLNRVLLARQPLICVQPYRPSLLAAPASDSAVTATVANDAHHAEPLAKASDAAVRPTTRCSHQIKLQSAPLRMMRRCRRLSHP